jgi:hypothetical protein
VLAAVAAATVAGAGIAAVVATTGDDDTGTVTAPAMQPGDTAPPDGTTTTMVLTPEQVPGTIGPGGPLPTGPLHTGTPPAEGSPEAELLADMNAAIEGREDMIVHTRQDNADYGDDDTWLDEATGYRRTLQLNEAGEPSYDSGLTFAPDPAAAAPEAVDVNDPGVMPNDPNLPSTAERTVDHCFGEYMEAPMPQLPGRQEAEFVRDGLAEGSSVIDGTELVDGRELIRLVDVDLRDDAPVQLVDPETFLPAGVLGYGGVDEGGYLQTITYLPRTPENMALLEAPIGEGYTQVANLRGDGERLDAGCT